MVQFTLDSDHFPKVISSLFSVIEGLIDSNFQFIIRFVPVLIEHMNIPEQIAKGLGACADDPYAASLTKISGDTSGFDPNIDQLC